MTTDSRKKKGKRSDSDSIKLKLIGVIAILVALALVVGLAVGLPKLMDANSKKNEASDVPASSGVTQSAVKNFPDDAGESALSWYVKLVDGLNDAGLPKDFFNDDESTGIMNDFADGKYDRMPKKIQDAVQFTDDAKRSDDRLIDYQTMKAAALTSLIMSWQLHKKAVDADKTFKPNQNGVMMDKAHGQVIFPMETICGLPATNVIVINWTGSEWKVNGDITGSQIAAQVRTNQLAEKYSEIQKSNKDTSGSK